MTCPVCGRKLCGSSSRGRNKIYPYYHCSSKCGTRFKADLLNDNYNEKLQRLVLSEKAVELFSLILDDVNITTQKTDCLNERRLIFKQLEDHELFISKARKLFVADKLRYDDYSEIKKEHQTNTGCLKKELDTVITKLRSIDEQFKLSNRSITHIFRGFPSLDIADKRQIINLIPPNAIDPNTGDFSLILNRTLSKVLIPKR